MSVVAAFDSAFGPAYDSVNVTDLDPVLEPLPTPDEVRTYVGVPAQLLSDTDLQRMYLAAIDNQNHRCRFPTGTRVVVVDGDVLDGAPTRPATLVQGLLRRVQRAIATKGLPLGVIGADGSEYGPSTVPRYDAMIETDEGPYRRVVAG